MCNSATTTMPNLFDDPTRYPYRLDLDARRMDVLEVDRDFFSAAFLDERALEGRRIGGWQVSLDEVLSAHREWREREPSPRNPGRWIFHVGHCGSTLLSRLLDTSPNVLGLREPMPLLALAAAQMDRDAPLARHAPETIDNLLAATTDLLMRGLAPADRVIIKATSTASLLAPLLLNTRTEDRAVLITLPLQRYLAVYLRDPALRVQARADALPRLAVWHQLTGDTSLRLWQLDDTQCIALNWRVDTDRFARLAADSATAARVRIVDGESLINDPASQLADVALHLRLGREGDDRDTSLPSQLLTRYAKDARQQFDPRARARELQKTETVLELEIRAATEWLAGFSQPDGLQDEL